MRSFARRALTTLAIGAWAQGLVLAVDIDQGGGISLLVSFEKGLANELTCGSRQAPLDLAGAQSHYCATMQQFSQELYYTTEGRHWIERVRFMEDLAHEDVIWNYITRECDGGRNDGLPCNKRCTNNGAGCGDDGDCGGGTCMDVDCPDGTCEQCPTPSYGSYKNGYILLREKGFTTATVPSPYQPSRSKESALAELLNHEFGHVFYQLPDEYVNFKNFRGGRTGICGQTFQDNSPGKSTGDVCDEEKRICPTDACIWRGECIEPPVNRGDSCDSDDDCDQRVGDGVCLGRNSDRNDKITGSTVRICAGPTNLPDTNDEVCLMRGWTGDDPYRRRWCDGGLTKAGQQLPGATHVYKLPADAGYGNVKNRVQYDMGNAFGPPTNTAEAFFERPGYVGHSCWADAIKRQADLAGGHLLGQYSTTASIGAPPPLNCEWRIDPLGTSPNPVLLVDKSGSMGYSDMSNPSVAAVDLAIDAALYFYNRVPVGNFAGVYLFDDDVVPATSGAGAVSLGFAQKPSDLPGIDGTFANGGTNIQKAIERGRLDIGIAPGVPWSTRDIVIFSDGKNNAPLDDPYAEAQLACNEGIFVHTIAYGDADSAALEKLAKCGVSWIAGAEDANDSSFSEPDPLEIKTAIARMGHAIAKETELLEHRADLEPLTASTVETQTFVVPAGSERLSFAWLANHTCVLSGPPPASCLPVLNLLSSVELMAPSGTIHTAPVSPDGVDGVYRRLEIVAPEEGTWMARIDKTEPVPPPSTIPGEWGAKVPDTRVAWIGHVDNASLEARAWAEPPRGPLNMPVAIRAQLRWGVEMTDLDVVATVTHRGTQWTVPLLDDGRSGDDFPADGIYGGFFNPDGDWTDVTTGGYRVKIRMESVAGQSTTFLGGELDGIEEAEVETFLVPQRGDAVVEAETSFRLSTRYALDPAGEPVIGSALLTCPDLLQGTTVAGLSVFVDGLALDPDDTRVSMGRGVDLTIDSLDCASCGNTGSDPSGAITFSGVVAVDAPTGVRDFHVQVGRDILVAEDACRVCSAPGVELCNGIDDDCNGLIDEDAFGEDSDGDGVPNACDNCTFAVNPSQSDFDGDGEGDHCDTDDGRIDLLFTADSHAEWDQEGGHTQWNVYRGDLAFLESTGIYTQLPGSNPIAAWFCNRSVTFVDDTFLPPVGTTAFYLVTYCAGGFNEGGLGNDSSGSPRPNDFPCPGCPPV